MYVEPTPQTKQINIESFEWDYIFFFQFQNKLLDFHDIL